MGTRSTNDPFYQELGKALKEARMNAGLTHSEAAAAIDHEHSNSIGRYESASRTPDIKTFAALTSAYEAEPTSILKNAISAAQQVKGNNVKKQKK